MANVAIEVGGRKQFLKATSSTGDHLPEDFAILSTNVESIVPGTSATSLGKAEDAVAASGDTGVMALAVRADTAAATGANGDYVPLLTDSTGRLHVATGATENHIGEVGGVSARPSGNFTRPSDTTAYASGDLVANSTTAGSVVPITIAVGRGASGSAATGMLRRLRLRKSGTSITNAQFRVHVYSTASITFANGDNGAWSTNAMANYIGSFDVTVDRAFTDGAAGVGVPTIGSEITFITQNVYAVLEARAAYTPGNAEVFTVELEVLQN